MRYILAAGFAGFFSVVLSTGTWAATITVTTLSDGWTGGPKLCSLRNAIDNANAETQTLSGDCAAGSGVDTIKFNVSGTIFLSKALPRIRHLLTIDGTSQRITVDGTHSYPVIAVNIGAALTLNRMTIAHGFNFADGGGIVNQGQLTVANSILSFNSATEFGGGIENEGKLTVIESVFADDGAALAGGGIDNRGQLIVWNSIFSRNHADQEGGGGIENDNGSAIIRKSTFSGNSSFAGLGGGIENYQGSLTLEENAFSGNSAPEGGGGIDNFGHSTVRDSIFSGNSASSAFGGGILNEDRLFITKSTFSRNDSLFGGGAIENNASLVATMSTFSNNSAYAAGGAIENEVNAMVVVTNNTFYHNSSSHGGGIENLDGSVIITNSTFSDNIALTGEGGAIQNQGALDSKSTILAASIGGDCAGTITDAGYNIAEDSTCGFQTIGSHNGTNPALDPRGLQNNGGPTQTIALELSSPAVGAIPVAQCTNQASPPMRVLTDQRGAPRPAHGKMTCDIGAYELQ